MTRTSSRRAPGHLKPALVALVLVLATAAASSAAVVFSTGFESGLPPEVTGDGVRVEGSQGLSTYGAATSVLRYHTQTLHDTQLTLTGLPEHTHVSLGFLLGLIDSWDGTELMQVQVDGQLVFSHWFQLATGDDSSYDAPAGALLSSGTNLGWSSGSYYGRDRLLDLSLEPAFQQIPHTAGTLTVTWTLGAVSGGAAANWQGGTDESWVLDNLTVAVGGGASAVPLPTAGARLLGNAPNPFNPSTRILFVLPVGGADVRLTVHDLRGALVRTLHAGRLPGGPGAISWDGRDDRGRAVPGGTYVGRLAGAGAVQARLMSLLK